MTKKRGIWRWFYSKYMNAIGYKICIIGPQMSGKTMIWRQLDKDLSDDPDVQVSKEYQETRIADNKEERHYKLVQGTTEFEITLAKSNDIGGSPAQYDIWKILYDRSNMVFYVVSASELLGNAAYREKVTAELTMIESWHRAKKSPFQLIVILSYCDQVPHEKIENLPYPLVQYSAYPPFDNHRLTLNVGAIIAGDLYDDNRRKQTIDLAFDYWFRKNKPKMRKR